MGCCSSKPEGDGREMSPRSAVAVKRQSRTRVGPQGDTQDSSDLKRITEKIERSHKTKVLNLENELLLTVPSGVGLIEGLRAVDVSRNKLTDVSPDFFDRSRTTLKKLGCGHNRIAKFPVGTFPALTHLVLTHNSLTETPDLTDYVCLKELDVSNNMISTIGPLPPSLTTIDLQGNRVSELPDTIFSLKNLHTLDLSKNRLLKFCSEEDAARMKSLKVLDISQNGIDELPESLFSATSLNALEISLNPVTEEDLKNMKSYEIWLKRKASTINKKIQGGATFDLIKN